jgi:hypothetical protein
MSQRDHFPHGFVVHVVITKDHAGAGFQGIPYRRDEFFPQFDRTMMKADVYGRQVERIIRDHGAEPGLIVVQVDKCAGLGDLATIYHVRHGTGLRK